MPIAFRFRPAHNKSEATIYGLAAGNTYQFS